MWLKLREYTKELARFAVETRFKDFPEEVVEMAKLCVLDWLGCNLAGQTLRSGKIIIEAIKELGGRPESIIVGTDLKTSCVNAAYANGWLGHAHDFDDCVAGCWIHGACVAIPGTLAVAEREALSGRDFITGIVIGYEVASRVARCVNTNAQHQLYWHTTATCGTLGAAAAAANLLNLEVDETIHCLGEAGNQAEGLSLVYGTMSKHSNPGRACRNGVFSALLAKKGMTSTRRILESPIGFCRLLHKEPKDGFDLELLTEGLGEKYIITGTLWKRYPACSLTHNPVDAALKLVKQYKINPDDVLTVELRTDSLAIELLHPEDRREEKYAPKTPEEAKFSLPYTVGAALYRGRLSLDEFTEEALRDPMLLRLVGKVDVILDPELDREYYRDQGTRVTLRVRTKDGEYIEESAGPTELRGVEELESKFKRLASTVLGKAEIMRALDALKKLEEVEDIREVTSLLKP